jgi:hypothetical protein
MKKTIILSVLGLTAAAVSSYGQGSISFNTYQALSGSGIQTTYGNGGQAGTDIGSTFTGELLWSSVNIPDVATTGPVAAGTQLTSGWTVGSTALFDAGSISGPGALGYIAGPDLNIASAVGTSLYFEVVAFTGASYATAGGYAGHSATFTSTLATGATLPGPNQMNNLAPFSVYTVTSIPEPTTLALAGLGGLASLVALRRKQA